MISPTPGQAWGRFPRTLEERIRILEAAVAALTSGATARVYSGIGDPNGVVTASAPAIYYDVTDAANPIQYIKTSGTGNTGWV